MNVVPKTAFDFGAIGNGTSITVTVGPAVDVLDFIDVGFLCRVHAQSVAASNIIRVSLVEYLDGSVEFAPILAGTMMSQDIVSTTPVPALLPVLMLGSAVPQVAVQLTATRAAAGNIRATVSIDVMMRNADAVTVQQAMTHSASKATVLVGGGGEEEPADQPGGRVGDFPRLPRDALRRPRDFPPTGTGTRPPPQEPEIGPRIADDVGPCSAGPVYRPFPRT